MITKVMLNTIKRADVSQNSEATKERFLALLASLSPQKKKQLKTEYGLSYAIQRGIKESGSISVKSAVIIALVTGADPYYLTAESDDDGVIADEARIREFLITHGYEKSLSISDSTESKSDSTESKKTPRKPRAQKSEAAQEPVVVEEFFISEPDIDELIEPELMSIQDFADMQMANLSDADKELIFDMPEEDFTYLLKTLELQAKYTDKVKNLVGLVRLILIR